MTRKTVSTYWLTMLSLAVLSSSSNAQSNGTGRPSAKPASSPLENVAEPARKLPEAATVGSAAKILDLRTFPVLEDAKVSSNRTLGTLMYEAKATPSAAYEFQRENLLKRGFSELAGGYKDATTQTGKFTNAGFHVIVSSSETTGTPKQVGWSHVSLVNEGNVALEKLPVPPGAKPFLPGVFRASYTTDSKPSETAAACRKLLLAAGWEPYGEAQSNATADTSFQYSFKNNAICLQAWISTAPAEGGKTLIRYSAELLSADLPAPPEIADPRYTDFQKTLRYDAPQDQTESILEFYQRRLPTLGWKATTDKPVVDENKKSQFLIFRNAEHEILFLDLTQFTGIVRVEVRQQTAAELAADEVRFQEQAELAKQEMERKNRKITISLPLPPSATKLAQDKENRLEFTLSTGSGPATLTRFRDHFIEQGWKEGKGTSLDKNSGHLEMRKDDVELRFSYFDSGVLPAEIRVTGPQNVVFAPLVSKEKSTVVKNKPIAKPAVPGLPELPPGMELPDNAAELIEKALQDAKALQTPKSKQPTPKR